MRPFNKKDQLALAFFIKTGSPGLTQNESYYLNHGKRLHIFWL